MQHDHAREDPCRLFAVTQCCLETFLLPSTSQFSQWEEWLGFCDGQFTDDPSVELYTTLSREEDRIYVSMLRCHIVEGVPHFTRLTFTRLCTSTGYFMPCSRDAAAIRVIQSWRETSDFIYWYIAVIGYGKLHFITKISASYHFWLLHQYVIIVSVDIWHDVVI